MNSLWIILACGLACAYALPACDQASLRGCENMVPFDYDDEIFPSDPVKFTELCLRTIPAFDCYVNVIDRCPGLVSKSFEDYFRGGKKLIVKVCNPGDFQTKYLRNAKCMNNVFIAKRFVCERKASDKAAQGSCPYFRAIENCMNASVESTCGSEAHEIFQENFRTMYENGACDQQK